MKPFDFLFSDALGRRGDFRRDIRSVGAAKGAIVDFSQVTGGDDCIFFIRLSLPFVSLSGFTNITMAIFPDPCFQSDTIVIPELNVAFYYLWDNIDFSTAKIMSVIDTLCYEKSGDSSLSEWDLLCIAAAVCAVYEYMDRLQYNAPPPGSLLEYLDMI